MKKTLRLFIMIFLASSIFVACDIEDNDNTNNSSTDEIAEDIAASMSSSNAGLTGEMSNTILLASAIDLNNLKSTASDTLISFDSTAVWADNNNYFSYKYTLNANYGLIYESGPTYSLFYKSSLTGNFDGRRVSMTDSRQSNWNLSGFESSTNSYTLNGETTRYGNTVSKIGNKSTISSVSNITVTNVKYNKMTLEILSGTLTWEITGTVNTTPFSYSTTIVYNGDGTADIKIGSLTYKANLTNGEIME